MLLRIQDSAPDLAAADRFQPEWEPPHRNLVGQAAPLVPAVAEVEAASVEGLLPVNAVRKAEASGNSEIGVRPARFTAWFRSR